MDTADKRIVVIANRLPVRRIEGSEGWETSPGGLVSSLTPFLQDRDGCWVGWAGVADESIENFSHDGIEQRPVPISAEEIENYYYGFCNGTIWPLYHDAVRTPEFHRHWWGPYVEVNQRFAREAAWSVNPDDIAWVQDYQLQLVPGYLREQRPDVTIGFYLHIPFPPVELFAQLPWRTQIIEGILGADVIAFQTALGLANFARAAQRFTSARRRGKVLEYGDRTIKLQRAPIAIDTAHFAALAESPLAVARAEALRRDVGDRRVILGVDRLDYTKGIDIRLRAFETLLDRNPGRENEFVFIQVAVPSREGVGEYTEMRNRIEQMVGHINGRFGHPGHVPVHYLYRNLPQDELVAYYLLADVMAVTPLRDGMNLVAKEYVATRLDNTGVLLLSEFTGAAESLTQALLVNPHDVDGLSGALAQAVDLPAEEMKKRMVAMRRYVKRNDIYDWARKCLGELGA
jgi:trehalose 6-phosphate synthase